MQKRPEHIDDIENFYRDQLKDLEVDPPSDAWNNIHKKIKKPAKPFYKSSGFIVTTVTVLFTGATLLLMQMQQEDNKVIEEFKNEHHLIPETKVEEPKAEPETIDSKAVENKAIKNTVRKSVPIVSSKDSSNTIKNSAKEETTNAIPVEQVKTETDKPVETTTEKKTPKSFYEKYSEEYKDKDSSRSLFKPSK